MPLIVGDRDKLMVGVKQGDWHSAEGAFAPLDMPKAPGSEEPGMIGQVCCWWAGGSAGVGQGAAGAVARACVRVFVPLWLAQDSGSCTWQWR